MQFMDEVCDLVTGLSAVNAVIVFLKTHLEGFTELEEAYLQSVRKIEQQMGAENRKRCTDAVSQQCASLLFYAGVQGFRMNYEHFQNPMLPNCTWPHVDFEDYMRPDMVYQMPTYAVPRAAFSDFWKSAPEELQSEVGSSANYLSAIETAGMKTAHFLGYQLANRLLRSCVLGYRPDPVLDLRYGQLMDMYFGKELPIWPAV